MNISGVVAAPFTPIFAGVGGSGQLGIGISTDFTLGGTQLIGVGQAAGMLTTGAFAGYGLTFGVGRTDGPLPVGPSYAVTGHAEVNAGAGPSGGLAVDYDMNSITGASGGVRLPGWGMGAMAGSGVAVTGTLASPAFRDWFNRARLARNAQSRAVCRP